MLNFVCAADGERGKKGKRRSEGAVSTTCHYAVAALPLAAVIIPEAFTETLS